ncbi:MAG: ABC transporter permease subunit [Acidocella sp.]|nr:ABC transporter permease subunit [Acidocella sp.]
MTSGMEIVWQQRNVMLHGLATTIELSLVSLLLAALLGTGIFAALIHRAKPVRFAAVALVDAMRCIPFMLVAYLLYYGAPSAGLTMDNVTVGIVALSLYHASYMAELLRGAWKELPKDTVDAGIAFGFHGVGLLRIVLPPVVIAAVPMLGNQFIQIIKDSAFLIIIAVEELTFSANAIQSIYYVPFASFVCAVLCYWMLCLMVEGGVKAFSVKTALRR